MTDKIVLVTGINGYIGSNIGLQLLQKGYTVRGTSRSSSAREQLLSEAYIGFEDEYQHCVVPDITAARAFDEAVKGVHAIIHVASPIDFSLPDVEAFFGPAAGGVTSILNSAMQAGPQLKSFVMTSSIAAVTDALKNPIDHVYSEKDWNTSSEEAARKRFSAPLAYGASKAIAERTFWDWRDDNRPTFAMSALNPGVVMGPPIVWPAHPSKLNETLAPIWKLFSGEKVLPPIIGKGVVIDVRDVSRLHVWCVEHPEEANGQRFIAVSGKMTPQAYADILQEHYPDRDVLIGNPGEGYIPETFEFPAGQGGMVTNKMYTALGGKDNLISPTQMILDTAEAFEKRWPEALRNKKRT